MTTSNAIATPIPTVSIVNGIVKTTSKAIAEFFKKRHDNVMRDIRNRLPDMGEWGVLNFEETSYIDPQNGQKYTMFEMTKDGFIFVVQKVYRQTSYCFSNSLYQPF